MKKSDYKIEISFVHKGIVYYEIFRRARKEYKIGKWTFYFTGKFEPISRLLTREHAEAALLEIYECALAPMGQGTLKDAKGKENQRN